MYSQAHINPESHLKNFTHGITWRFAVSTNLESDHVQADSARKCFGHGLSVFRFAISKHCNVNMSGMMHSRWPPALADRQCGVANIPRQQQQQPLSQRSVQQLHVVEQVYSMMQLLDFTNLTL